MVFLMSGDFRQVLPIVPGASDARIKRCCLKYSKLWSEEVVQVFKLKENERVKRALQCGDTESAKLLERWAKYLLDVGENKIPKNEVGDIEVPKEIMANSHCIKDFVTEIFPNLDKGLDNAATVILTCLNKDMDAVNNICLQRFPGEEVTSFKSIDSVIKCADPSEFDIQYLNSRTPSGKLTKRRPLTLMF